MEYKYPLSSFMLHQITQSALRRSSLLVVIAVVIGLMMAGTSVAPAPTVASTKTEEHDAARRARFTRTAQAVDLPAQIVIKPQKSSALLPVVDKEDIEPKHRILADNVLRALPRDCRENLKNFYVNYDKNASNRGLGGADTIIIIGTVPDDEFRALLIHECGHVTDIGGLRGTPESGLSGFFDGNTPIYQNDASVAFYHISWIRGGVYQPNSKDSDFVSGYSESDPFEDFAETYAFYALHKEEFKKLTISNRVLNAKYNFMERYIFTNTPSIASGTFTRDSRIPWDITKLPFVWVGERSS